MKFCNDHGIPHSKLLEWSTDDRAKMMAQLQHEGATCPRCGTRPDEWDPEQGGSHYAYEPREDICRGCEIKDFIQQDSDKQDIPGRYVSLVPAEVMSR